MIVLFRLPDTGSLNSFYSARDFQLSAFSASASQSSSAALSFS